LTLNQNTGNGARFEDVATSFNEDSLKASGHADTKPRYGN
jgi:hypothetical protein